MGAQDGDIKDDVKLLFYDNEIIDPVGPAILLRSTNWFYPNMLQMELSGASFANIKVMGGSFVVVAIEAKGSAAFANIDVGGAPVVGSNALAGCEKPPKG